MKRFLILTVVVFMSFLIHASMLDVSLTDNVYNSASKEYDLQLNADYNGRLNTDKFDIFLNFGLFTPFINNYMMSLPSDISFQFVPIDNLNRTFMLGAYSFETFYPFEEYRENNILAPGLFFDHKEYVNDYLIVRNSLDGRMERYLFLNDFSNSKIEASTKWMVGLPIGMSVHLNGFFGYKLNSDNSNVKKWSISPLVSLNLFDNIGLSLSGLYSQSIGETLDYYIDDTFIDEYFYSEGQLKGKATILTGKDSRIVFSCIYSVRDYLPLLYTADTDGFTAGAVESREDSILTVEITVKVKKEGLSPYLSYIYERRVSTNAQYSYNSNSLTLGIEF